jgi:hypothetical protein
MADGKQDFIKAEELCTKLNAHTKSDQWTFNKIMKLARQKLIKFHDLRTPGTKTVRYFFVFDEVLESLQNIK